jgi:uncharacterized protein (TIGR03000 family)
MPRHLRSSLLVTVVAALAPAAARAQYVGVGVARPGGIYGAYSPSYLGIYPGGYNGFYSNGFSMYGPPVPTYGSVPGFFGGADQRLGNFPNIYIQNGADIGLGGSGAGGAGPRRRHYAGVDGAATPAMNMGQALIDVRVPAADAEVYFEGTNTRQSGVRRLFQSPAVPTGATLYYKIHARWKQPDGKVVDQERSVGVRAHETTVVDFGSTPIPPEVAGNPS